jgi:hypothetical protein
MQGNVEPEVLGLFGVLLQVHSDLPKKVRCICGEWPSKAIARLQDWKLNGRTTGQQVAINLPDESGTLFSKCALKRRG